MTTTTDRRAALLLALIWLSTPAGCDPLEEFDPDDPDATSSDEEDLDGLDPDDAGGFDPAYVLDTSARIFPTPLEDEVFDWLCLTLPRHGHLNLPIVNKDPAGGTSGPPKTCPKK